MKSRIAKKSETIEIRLSYDVKEALKAKTQREGKSISEVLRSFIDRYIADAPGRQSADFRLGAALKRPRTLLALLMGAAVVLSAQLLPAAAQDVTLEVSNRMAGDLVALDSAPHVRSETSLNYGDFVPVELNVGDKKILVKLFPVLSETGATAIAAKILIDGELAEQVKLKNTLKKPVFFQFEDSQTGDIYEIAVRVSAS